MTTGGARGAVRPAAGGLQSLPRPSRTVSNTGYTIYCRVDLSNMCVEISRQLNPEPPSPLLPGQCLPCLPVLPECPSPTPFTLKIPSRSASLVRCSDWDPQHPNSTAFVAFHYEREERIAKTACTPHGKRTETREKSVWAEQNFSVQGAPLIAR